MKYYSSLSAILFCSIVSNAQGPSFSLQLNIPVTENATPLQNPWAGGINFALWGEIDLNGDGIHDLFMYDRVNDRISTFINSGISGSHSFHYDPEYVSRFPDTKIGSWMLGYDYNCDGKTDLFVLDTSLNGISVYRNDYSIGTGLQFTLVKFALTEGDAQFFIQSALPIFASTIYVPALIDVDNDGDMDILTFNSSPNGKICWHRNYSMEEYGVCDSLDFKHETECWGKFRLSLGSNSVSLFHDSCTNVASTASINSVEDQYYEIAKKDDTVATLFAFDNDGDGSKDLLIGDLASNTSLMVHNGGTPEIAEMDSQDVTFPAYNTPIAMYDFNRHSYIDVDNDSVKDLLVSAGTFENSQGVWYYQNTGTTASPVFNFQRTNFLQEEMIDVGEAASPVFFDENNDGLPDLIIGNSFSQAYPSQISGLSLYRNVGTSVSPSFQLITHQYAGVNSLSLYPPIRPAFGDMDGDGDTDMIIGSSDGKLQYFENSAGAGNPANFSFTIPNYMGIDVGNGSAPQIIDLDRDGKPDLIVGEKSGNINYFNNVGTATVASFSSVPTITTLGNVDVHTPGYIDGWAVPFVYDDGGQYKMIVSCMKGDVYYYTNIDGNLTGAFTLSDTLIRRTQGIRANYNLSVSGADINGDSKTDLVLGLVSGGLQIYYQDSSHDGIEEYSANENIFTIHPNPANKELSIQSRLLSGSKSRIEIFNVFGESIVAVQSEDNNPKAEISVNVTALASGMYFVKLTSPLRSQTKKLIIIH